MKLVSAHQPQFFPHLSFFEKIATVDSYVCLDKLKYSRHSYQTRNKIKIDSDTGWAWIFVPLKNNDNNFHSIENGYGKFSRSFQLPDNIDENKISAKHKNGILNISIEKDEKTSMNKTIQIK